MSQSGGTASSGHSPRKEQSQQSGRGRTAFRQLSGGGLLLLGCRKMYCIKLQVDPKVFIFTSKPFHSKAGRTRDK